MSRRRRLLPAVDAQVLMSSLATFVAGLPSVLQNKGVADAAGGSGDSLRSVGICLFILLLALHNICLHTLGTIANGFEYILSLLRLPPLLDGRGDGTSSSIECKRILTRRLPFLP